MLRTLKFIRVSHCRALSALATVRKYPDRVLAGSLPSPRPWATPSPARALTPPATSIEWQRFEGEFTKLHKILRNFQTALRSVHKRKIIWPADESYLATLEPGEYLQSALQPVASFFNELRSPHISQVPVECVNIDLGSSLYAVTYRASHLPRWQHIPIVVALPDPLFDNDGNLTPPALFAVSSAMKYDPSVFSVIVTNFDDIAVFLPSGSISEPSLFGRVYTPQPGLTIRVLAAACTWRSICTERFIDRPALDNEADPDLVLPYGPPTDPNQPLTPDEEVFATHHRHSDFDFATLVRDRERALQFFRWHAHIRQHYPKVVAHPGDVITAATYDVAPIPGNPRPLYPFDHSELPDETVAHIEDARRVSPLASAGIEDAFAKSKLFTLKVQDVIAEGSSRGICTVYLCQLTSIDGCEIESPVNVCLKLFDDRFQELYSPVDPESMDRPLPLYFDTQFQELHYPASLEEASIEQPLPRYFDDAVLAGNHALNEAAAYDKLRPVQGSLVPWFFGVHKFTLPNGFFLYGLIMEYIEGCTLASTSIRTLSDQRQIDIIRSCRHSVRTLDVADIRQLDWHESQVLVYQNPTTQLDHAVLMDFASTIQTWSLEQPNLIQNYFGMWLTLDSDSVGDGGPKPELVWENFGEPDDWDCTTAVSWIGENSDVEREIEARDMFPFISIV
ncbi:hypothetical protein BDW22DRAFT_1361710 [Trametopsis cervina]|nr:hypothetical protein BDW22DRAFT_1361710 [Trametopsis cervina]